jgi:2-octaprenylphenol hydroxylase
MTRRCDIAVVGGGMVGATLAALLAADGWKVAVIEAHAPRLPEPGQRDMRVSALARSSQRLLQHIGAWEVLAGDATAYTAMAVWDGTGSGRVRFTAAELGEPDLGHIVENSRIRHAAWALLEAHPDVTLYSPATVAALLLDARAAQLELEPGGLLEAGLVVAADGGHSRIRAWSGLHTVGWGYGQKTLVGNLHTERPHQATCWQRFTPSGPVAFLPLPDGECSLAWHTSERHADYLLKLDDRAFCAELEVASGGILGLPRTSGPRGAFRVRLEHALHYHARRVVLVGDAAHTIHPLAGQGVNLGLRDAAALAAVLRNGGDDPGGREALARYQRQRQPDNLAMLLVMDAFKRGFGNDRTLLRVARNRGLDLAERVGGLKRALMRRALGLQVTPGAKPEGLL